MVKTALKFLEAGYSVIPVDEHKQPLCNWTKYQSTRMAAKDANYWFKDAWGIAIICYDQLEVIDFDLKYDITDRLWYEYKSQIPQELKDKLLVNKTMNGGYHILYKCSVTEGNKKLAQRASTTEEKHITYLKEYLDPDNREKALDIARQDKVRVLIETRGGVDGVGGGYVLAPPSPGYKRVHGKGIFEITPEERAFLHNLAKSFDTYEEIKNEFTNKAVINRDHKFDETSPFDDFDSRVDMVNLMTSYGWTVASETSSIVRLKRPGGTKASSSGILNKGSNILKVFSTSHVLYNGDTGVNPSTVFTILECNGDKKEAYKKLIEMGYGKSNS